VLAAADILVSPRLQGINTPLKIYSYLSSGRPIVATRLLTHTQVLNDEVALLVEPSPQEMAGGILRLLGDSELRASLGGAGSRYVAATYGRKRFEDRLRSFYGDLERELVGESRARAG
jgi:glycosyltransferase involved in cell wall biosynthesis